MTKLHEVREIGQAIWLDYIRRSLMTSGELKSMIDNGLMGMTSNPAIFEKAISGGGEYDDQLRELAAQGKTAMEIYEAIAIQDIQNAADTFQGVYETSNAVDGYVSLEANPHLAHETQGTIDEVHSLAERVQRPNVMYKIPATPEGIAAVEHLVGEGFSINITLMFSMDHYNKVAMAYINGLEKYAASGGDLSKVASVASFFVSRVDVILADRLPEGSDLLNKIAIANAKLVYARFKEIFSGERWEKLTAQGAQVQRPLWASTSTKSPDLPDTLYVDTLIGPHTVNTLPPNTLEAFIDHGTVANTVEQNMDEATDQIAQLTEQGINLLDVGEELQDQGVAKFIKPFDDLIATIDAKRQTMPQG